MSEYFPLNTDDLHHIKEVAFNDRYFTVLPHDQGVQFHDPLTQEPLQPGHIPPSIEQAPDLAAGNAYLRHRAQETFRVQLFLAPHGGAEDFATAQAAYGEHLQAVPHLGVETSWTMPRPNTPPTLAEVAPDLSHSPPRREAFQRAVLDWLDREGKQPLFCDITDGSTPQSAMNTAINKLWNDIFATIPRNPHLTPAQQNAAQTIAERLYQCVRQSAIVARLGWWGLRLESAGQQPDHLNLMAGSWHISSLARLQRLGNVQTTVHRTPEDPQQTAAYKEFARGSIEASITGRAGMRYLSIPRPH